MKTFEALLLKTGSPDLICASANDYKDMLSADFRIAIETYAENIT